MCTYNMHYQHVSSASPVFSLDSLLKTRNFRRPKNVTPILYRIHVYGSDIYLFLTKRFHIIITLFKTFYST